jgi:hypothetical protein
MDQQVHVGDKTRRRILSSVNEKIKKILENSVKKPDDANFVTPDI